jgi:RNAse (barnase) inhibitor barstar
MYAYKEKYTLDFSKMEKEEQFHQILKKELDLPHNYGENWDALWDCLTDMVNVNEPLYIEIVGAEILEQHYHGKLEGLLEILKDLKHWRNDHFCDYVKLEILYGDARYEIQ